MRENPWLQLREGDASFPATPDADRVPQGNEMRKNTRLGVAKPLRSFPSTCCDEGGTYDLQKLAV